MKFSLYSRGCRFGIKEGWLLLLACFKWLKDHYEEIIKIKTKDKERSYSLTTFPGVKPVQQVTQGIPTTLPKTTTTHLSGSGPRTEFGDRIIRRPVPLAVHPFQILWNLTTGQLGFPQALPGSYPT